MVDHPLHNLFLSDGTTRRRRTAWTDLDRGMPRVRGRNVGLTDGASLHANLGQNRPYDMTILQSEYEAEQKIRRCPGERGHSRT